MRPIYISWDVNERGPVAWAGDAVVVQVYAPYDRDGAWVYEVTDDSLPDNEQLIERGEAADDEEARHMAVSAALKHLDG